MMDKRKHWCEEYLEGFHCSSVAVAGQLLGSGSSGAVAQWNQWQWWLGHSGSLAVAQFLAQLQLAQGLWLIGISAILMEVA